MLRFWIRNSDYLDIALIFYHGGKAIVPPSSTMEVALM